MKLGKNLVMFLIGVGFFIGVIGRDLFLKKGQSNKNKSKKA